MALDQPEVATVVEREVRIAARPETVFEFFTDPEKMVLWKGRQASLDPRPGGIYRVEMGDQIVARGEYVEVDAIVTDEQGNFVRDLKRDNFQVSEDGKPQNIATFSVVDHPTPSKRILNRVPNPIGPAVSFSTSRSFRFHSGS